MQRFQPPRDLTSRSGAELLRLLTERNLPALAVWCSQCGCHQIREDNREPEQSCPRCGAPYICLDDHFLRWISNRIRQALRQEPTLLARVKGEFQAIRGEDPLPLALKNPPRPLRWLSEAWKKAGRPSGRPLQSARHFQLYRVMQFLRDLGLRLTDIQGLFGHQAMGEVQEEPREVLELFRTYARRYLVFRENGLTEQAIRKEMHREWRERRAQWTDLSDRGEKLYERLEQAHSHTVDALLSRDMAGVTEQAIVNHVHASWRLAVQRPQNTIKGQMQDVTLLLRKWFGSIRPEELWRRCRWVEHQFYVPQARLSGERVKDMKMSKVRGWVSLQRLRGAAPQPSNRDYFHFKMISVLVRQEGLSKAVAIAGLAKQYGENGSVELIRQSLARVSRYEEAVAPVVGRELVEPRDFWQPGILKERLEKLFKTKA